jgi:large subunit ribosomal protein L30
LEKARETIWIRQVRSGIGFPRKQKSVLRCLGLRRLHQLEERPDTPQVRGLVAKVRHLVEIVSPSDLPRRDSGLPYTVQPPVVAPAETVAASTVEEAQEAVTAGEPGRAPAPAAKEVVKAAAKPSKPTKAQKKQRAETGKSQAAAKAEAKKAAEPKGKAAKPSRTAKK